ncbi:putative intracellular protease/amidase [Ensifer sp. 4252]
MTNPMKWLRGLAAALALTLVAADANAAKVLVVLSGSDHLDLRDSKVFRTGFYLNELMQPVKLLLEAGHEITFATPGGQVPAVDRTSVDPAYFGGSADQMKVYQDLLDELAITSPEKSPVIGLARVAQIGYASFDAVYIPGGHAPMQDLLHDRQLGQLLAYFHENGKITALVCHGPIALLSTLADAKALTDQLEALQQPERPTWIYSGYRMTVISNQEEELAKGLLDGGAMKFYPQTALEAAGGKYQSNAAPWQPKVVVDRELITGQNPASALQVGEMLVERLK